MTAQRLAVKGANVATIRQTKRRRTSANKRNLIIDIIIGVVFLIVFFPDATSLAIHEWLSLGLFGGLLTHVLLHWKWVVNVSNRVFNASLPRATRINYIINNGLALAVTMVMVSGLMIAEVVLLPFGLSGGSNFWEALHELAANGSLLLVVTHVLLHTKWLVTNIKKYLLRPNLHRFAKLNGTMTR